LAEPLSVTVLSPATPATTAATRLTSTVPEGADGWFDGSVVVSSALVVCVPVGWAAPVLGVAVCFVPAVVAF
jgi:hypothetical protein